MDTVDLSPLIDELVIRSADDDCRIAEVFDIAVRYTSAGTFESRRQIALEILRIAIQQGLIAMGDLQAGGEKFVPWKGSDSIVRLEREWLQLGRSPVAGELGWCRATDAGIERFKVLTGRPPGPAKKLAG